MITRAEFIERTLVLRSREGDQRAFEDLIELHHTELSYYVRGLLGRPEGAEDVVQEVWLAVYRQIRRLKDKAMDVLRLKPRELRSMDRVQELMASEEAEEEFSAQDAAAIHAAMRQLTLEHREVLTLRFMQELSYEQIASVTGCDLGTIKSRIFNAKRWLRREMEKSS